MKRVEVDLGRRSYDILIAPSLLKRAGELLDDQNIGKRLFLVTTTTVYEHHGPTLRESLDAAGFRVTEIFIPDGEKFKNLHTVENIYTYLIAQRADRFSTVAALGGGVTGDIAGFVAATFLRGVPSVQFPTTLLAQVDSSVGGKTGVNHPHGKNMIGVFHQPSLVCVDIDTLATLSRRELRSGVFEVLKYGIIRDRTFFEYLEENVDRLMDRDAQTVETVIQRCCSIKAEVISIDERESGLRRILNFGHTFGHALEVVSGYHGITHGEAVAYGMLAAALLSAKLKFIGEKDFERISRLIQRVGKLPPSEHFPIDEVLEAMNRDKKRHGSKKVFVLLDGIGKTVIHEDPEDRVLKEVWSEVVSLSQALRKA